MDRSHLSRQLTGVGGCMNDHPIIPTHHHFLLPIVVVNIPLVSEHTIAHTSAITDLALRRYISKEYMYKHHHNIYKRSNATPYYTKLRRHSVVVCHGQWLQKRSKRTHTEGMGTASYAIFYGISSLIFLLTRISFLLSLIGCNRIAIITAE